MRRGLTERLVWHELEKFMKTILLENNNLLIPKPELVTDGNLDKEKVIDAWYEAVSRTQSDGGHPERLA